MTSYVRICKEEKSWEGGLLFWKPEAKGYTADPDAAGLFSEDYHHEDTLSVPIEDVRELPVRKFIEYGKIAELIDKKEKRKK